MLQASSSAQESVAPLSRRMDAVKEVLADLATRVKKLGGTVGMSEEDVGPTTPPDDWLLELPQKQRGHATRHSVSARKMAESEDDAEQRTPPNSGEGNDEEPIAQ